MSRVAVIQTAFPGDVVLCTPVFESLKKAGHHVVAITRPQSEPILRYNPNIDKLISYDKGGGLSSFIGAVSELKSQECDTALIVQRYFKSALLPLFAGIDRRIGYDKAPASFLYTEEARYEDDSHEVLRCLSLCRGLSVTVGYSPEIFISEAERSRACELLNFSQGKADGIIIIAPGSIWPTKRWLGYRDLIRLINGQGDWRIILLGSDDDYSLCEEMRDCDAVNLAGKTNILESAAIIEMARLVISNDSAPAHIASAVGTPVVAIFGPTITEFGFAPFSSKSAVVEYRHLYCRPCSLHGSKKCPEGHFRCMVDISPEKVWAECERVLDKYG